LIGAIAAAFLFKRTDEPQPPASQPAVVAQKAPTVSEDLSKAIAPEPKKEEPAPAPPTVETVTAPEMKDEIKDEPSEPKEVRRPSTKRVTKQPVAAPASKEAPGILRVGGSTFAWVTVGNQTKEHTEKFLLPPGKYTVKVKNDLTKETKTYTVDIKSENVTRIVPEWEDE
jgi:hypothetical protein